MTEEVRDGKFHQLDVVLDKIENSASYVDRPEDIDKLVAYLQRAADGTYLDLVSATECYPEIPNLYGMVNRLDIYLRVDASIQAITSANGVGDLDMMANFANQILLDVENEREKRKLALAADEPLKSAI